MKSIIHHAKHIASYYVQFQHFETVAYVYSADSVSQMNLKAINRYI